MAQPNVDQLSAIKASLELMVAENGEIHEHFKDLLGQVTALADEEPEQRRARFQELVSDGAFRFKGVDVRHFAHVQRGPLPPPLFYARTRRRLRNTQTLVEQFAKHGPFEGADVLRSELDLLDSSIVNETDPKSVQSYKAKVDELRESPPFLQYLEVRNQFIRQDEGLRTDAEMISTQETLEEAEEALRLRAEELDQLSQALDSGSLDLALAQAKLDDLALPEADAADGESSPADEPMVE